MFAIKPQLWSYCSFQKQYMQHAWYKLNMSSKGDKGWGYAHFILSSIFTLLCSITYTCISILHSALYCSYHVLMFFDTFSV